VTLIIESTDTAAFLNLIWQIWTLAWKMT